MNGHPVIPSDQSGQRLFVNPMNTRELQSDINTRHAEQTWAAFSQMLSL